MLGKVEIFSQDYGHIFDTSSKSPAAIFNEAILPRVSKLAEEADPGGLEEAARQREAQLEKDLEFDAFASKADDNFLSQMQQPQANVAPVVEENYDAPVSAPVSAKPTAGPVPQNGMKIKLSNYGYDSDSSPDYNSNVLRIGHSNNKLENGVSAALTKSLASRYGLKTGDMFEAVTADGQVLKRRYDDTVPTKYKGKPLPETVDLYEVGGSNNFAGVITGIRPLSTR